MDSQDVAAEKLSDAASQSELNVPKTDKKQQLQHRRDCSIYSQIPVSRPDLKKEEQGLTNDIENLSCKQTTEKTMAVTPDNIAPYIDQDQMPRNVSNTSTLASIVCVVAGTGILGIPHALGRSGWIGIVFLLLSSVMAQYCGCLLIRCLYYGQSRRLSGFSEIGRLAFGSPGRVIGGVFSQFLLFSTPTLYIILAGDNLSKLVAAAGISIGRQACTWMAAAAVGIPFVLVRTMRDISFVSFFASMSTVCVMLVVSVVSASDYQDRDINAHHDLAIPENIPIAFSTFSFAFCGNVIFPHLEGAMGEPARWPKVLLVATFAISLMYTVVGFLCYFVYGDSVQNPVYESIPKGSGQNIAMVVATIHVLLATPMYLYVFTTTVETYLGIHRTQKESKHQGRFRFLKSYPQLCRILLRALEICICAAVAMVTPYFSDLMTLIGTIAAESLTFILPCVFWIKLSWKDGQTWELLVCAFMAILGTFCAVFGTADAVKAFSNDIRQV